MGLPNEIIGKVISFLQSKFLLNDSALKSCMTPSLKDLSLDVRNVD
jgi:hypothetical protein